MKRAYLLIAALLVLSACGPDRPGQAAEALSPDAGPGARGLFSLYWNASETSPVCTQTQDVTVQTDAGVVTVPECVQVTQVTQYSACATVDVPVPASCLPTLAGVYADAGCAVGNGGSRIDCTQAPSTPLTNGCVWLPLDAPTAAQPDPMSVCGL